MAAPFTAAIVGSGSSGGSVSLGVGVAADEHAVIRRPITRALQAMDGDATISATSSDLSVRRSWTPVVTRHFNVAGRAREPVQAYGVRVRVDAALASMALHEKGSGTVPPVAQSSMRSP